MNISNQTKIWLILLSLWIINGSSFLAIKVAIDTIPPLLSAGLRFSLAGTVLFALYYIQNPKRKFVSKEIIGSKSEALLKVNSKPSQIKTTRELITMR